MGELIDDDATVLTVELVCEAKFPHVLTEVTSGVTDVDSGLLFIPRQNPYLTL